MKRTISRKYASLTLGSLVLLLAGTARAEYPFRTGSFSVSPQLGVLITANNAEGVPGTAAFGIGSDFDYHLTPNFTIGGTLNLGFGSDTILFDIGPEMKYRFNLGASPHVPYLKGAFLIRIRHLSIGNAFASASTTAFGLGIVQFGGGYKYFFNPNLGVGIDLGFIPSVYFFDDTLGGSKFLFGIHILFGIDYRFGA
jgi:hypothetical protein